MTDAVRKYEISPVHTIIVWGRDMKVVPKSLADAAIAELQDKLDRAQEYARIEVKRKGEAVERECAAIERAEKAEAELGELDSYNGHLKWMDKHYPLDVSYFAEGEDVGCQVMRMSRKVMASEAALAEAYEKIQELDDKLMEAEGAHENARRWFEEQKKQFARAEKAEDQLEECRFQAATKEESDVNMTIVGHCPKCGAPLYSPMLWNGITPPPVLYSCSCNSPNAPRVYTTNTTEAHHD